jgi:transposase-like protein
MELAGIFARFPTHADCIKHLEAVRWRGLPTCPYCYSNRATPIKNEWRYQCSNCNTAFSVTVGTILHNTKLPLQKWFLAIFIILKVKKDISARQLGKELLVTKDTAWRISNQIRFMTQDSSVLLKSIIDINDHQTN